MHQPGFGGFGASCPVHTDRPVVGTCARCGSFMCQVCNLGGQETQCEKCRLISGAGAFPFTRQDFTFDRVWNFCFEAWKREWLMLSVCVLILWGSAFAGRIVGQIVMAGVTPAITLADKGVGPAFIAVALVGLLVTQLVSQIVQGIAQMGLMRVCMDVLQGRPADVARMFSQLQKAPRYVGLMFIQFGFFLLPFIGLFGGIGALLFARAGGDWSSLGSKDELVALLAGGMAVLWIGILLAVPVFTYGILFFHLAGMEILYGDCGPFQALGRAWALLADNRLALVGYGFIAGLVLMLGVFACCVGALPAGGLAQLLMSGFFMALRNGSNLPPPREA